jgi:uncharacterized membrane protein
MRETEVDRVWALSRMPMSRIHHLRSKYALPPHPTPILLLLLALTAPLLNKVLHRRLLYPDA